jgi:hypothetical protein
MEKRKFKIGDRVQVKNLPIAHTNRVGVIVSTQVFNYLYPEVRYWVNFLDRPVAIGWRYSEHELELYSNPLQRLKDRYGTKI